MPLQRRQQVRTFDHSRVRDPVVAYGSVIDMRNAKQTSDPSAELVGLIYELLDAHEDTVRLALEMGGDEQWAAHIDYLRRLQRVGREALARETVAAAS
jgi:hypothetical protein